MNTNTVFDRVLCCEMLKIDSKDRTHIQTNKH